MQSLPMQLVKMIEVQVQNKQKLLRSYCAKHHQIFT